MAQIRAERFGPWALVAGGSEGIGLEFVRQLAGGGLNVLALAEKPDPLTEACRTVARETGRDVQPVVLDLGREDLLARLAPALEGREVGMLVCNAAHSYVGPFLEEPLESKLAALHLNCRAPLLLVHELGGRMAKRGRGAIVLMSSLAGRQGTPLVATYAASKAFDHVLGESLWDELGRHGVDVLALCPGATRTPGWQRSAPRLSRLAPPVMEPADVVREGLSALGREPSRVVGLRNRLAQLWLGRLSGRRQAVRIMSRAMRAQYGR